MTDDLLSPPKGDAKPDTPPTWAIVELMGHVKHAGRLTEEEKFGCKLGRLDILGPDGFQTIYFGGASVYRISVVTEAVARHVADSIPTRPVSPWDFPRQLPAPVSAGDDSPQPYEPDDEDEDDDDPDESDF